MVSETLPATEPPVPPQSSPPALVAGAPSGAGVALVALVIAAGTGGLLQWVVPCGRYTAPFVGAAFAVVYATIAGELPARLRRALTAQDSFAAILAALAAVCVVGTLVVQRQGEAFYHHVYGRALAAAILRLGLDDAFHSLWFAGVVGVFCGTVVLSAARRWPPSRSNLGFHLSHLGLLVTLGGAAASSAFAVRGRIELRAGETANAVRVRSADRTKAAATERLVPLGFTLRLDRFDVDRYQSELRIGYYERQRDEWRLRASFEPERGVAHRLPDGASFLVTELRNDPAPAAIVRVTDESGSAGDGVLVAGAGGHVTPNRSGALVLERRPLEVKAFRSWITAAGPHGERTAVVAVNAPFQHGDWAFYQASYDPSDLRYSALEAVRDPGARWVFVGFALLATGVAHALYTAAWLRRLRRA